MKTVGGTAEGPEPTEGDAAPGMPRTLNVIGCGNLGRTLCRLWHDSGTFRIGCIRNRSLESAKEAAAFIGGGTPVADAAGLTSAEVTLLATPDDAIEEAAERFAQSGVLRPGDLVFHASGSLSSAILTPVRAAGAHVGSVHPIHSFADPASVSSR